MVVMVTLVLYHYVTGRGLLGVSKYLVYYCNSIIVWLVLLQHKFTCPLESFLEHIVDTIASRLVV